MLLVCFDALSCLVGLFPYLGLFSHTNAGIFLKVSTAHTGLSLLNI